MGGERFVDTPGSSASRSTARRGPPTSVASHVLAAYPSRRASPERSSAPRSLPEPDRGARGCRPLSTAAPARGYRVRRTATAHGDLLVGSGRGGSRLAPLLDHDRLGVDVHARPESTCSHDRALDVLGLLVHWDSSSMTAWSAHLASGHDGPPSTGTIRK